MSGKLPAGSPPLWRVRTVVGAGQAEAAERAFEAVLGAAAVAFARFEEGPAAAGLAPADLWRIEATCAVEPDARALSAALAAALGDPGIGVAVERLPDLDWLAENRRAFPPVAAGRFFVHGTHYAGPVPAGAAAIALDAGAAFGSGTHETTKGCLLAIDGILAETHGVGRALDLGCGSGILAIAIAKGAGVPVLASDSDPVAADCARANAAATGVAHLVTAVAEEGVGERVRARAPYGLVAANILAPPLIALAPGVAAVAAREGFVILSGLLAAQAEEVRAAYRQEGFAPLREIALGDWSTLVLRRG